MKLDCSSDIKHILYQTSSLLDSVINAQNAVIRGPLYSIANFAVIFVAVSIVVDHGQGLMDSNSGIDRKHSITFRKYAYVI